MDNNVYRTEAYGITMDINKGNERKRLPVRDFYTFEVCMSDFVTDMCWWFDMTEDVFIEKMKPFNAKIYEYDNGNKRMYFDKSEDIYDAIKWLAKEWMPKIMRVRELLNNGQKIIPDPLLVRLEKEKEKAEAKKRTK